MMYKRILVPLDGSKRAEEILVHVEELARASGARVILLCVLEAPPVPSDIVGCPCEDDEWRQECEHQKEEAVSYMAGRCKFLEEKGITVSVCLEKGPVVGTIMHVAEREEADLVALTSHGRTGLSQVFHGSVAAGLLHRIDRPLLLIRSHKHAA